MACTVALLAQVTEEMFEKSKKKYIKIINDTIKRLKDTYDSTLKFPKLDNKSLQLRVYSDASYSNNEDKSSQLGYIIFLMDKHNRCQPLFWSSHKSKRVSRSVLGSETMAFADAFDMAYVIKYDLQLMLGKVIPISMMTDSLSLFDVITKSTITTERRLMIDIKAAKESYQKNEIQDIAYIRSENNPADAITKIMKQSILDHILRTNKIEHPVEQWIQRSAMKEDSIVKEESGNVNLTDS